MNNTIRKSDWRCVGAGCPQVLGQVVGNELEISPEITGENIRPRGSNLVIVCPTCGAKKVWYTSDNLDRSVHQLVETLASLIAYKTIQKIQEAELKPATDKE